MGSKAITFNGVLENQFDSFLQAKKELKSHKNKTVHQLRVAIKHLKIYSHFIDRFLKSDGNSENIRKQLKPVFKSAGNIRTALLNIKLSENNPACKSYVEHLKKSLDKAQHELKHRKKVFKNNSLKKHAKKIKTDLKSVKSQAILDECRIFILEKENLIRKELKQKVTAEKLHEIRKNLKIIKVMKKVYADIKGGDSQEKKLSNLTQLEETIGKWHDKVALLEDLKKYASKKQIKKQLRDFITKLHKEVTDSQNRSVLLVKNYFK